MKRTIVVIVNLLVVLMTAAIVASAQPKSGTQSRSIFSEDFENQRPTARSGARSKSRTAGSSQQKESPQSRSIYSDDFENKRPPARSGGATRPRRVPYQYVRTVKNPLERKPPIKPATKPNAPPPPKSEPMMAEVGVTVWKLRPPEKGEDGEMMSVVVNGKREKWIRERVSPVETFSPDDKLSFGVESSKTGFLYILDRETRQDGTFGAPCLLFPESLRDDNSVGPGILVDIPPSYQQDPYFNITRRSKIHNGELMTIIISPTPMDLKVGKGDECDGDSQVLDNDLLSEIEFGSESSIFTRTDKADRIFTTAESQATACATKDRQLVREKTPGQQCTIQTRQLTRAAPLPETIYQVKSPPDKPGALFLRLAIR